MRVIILMLLIAQASFAINWQRVQVYTDSEGERAGIKVPLGFDKLALAIQPPQRNPSADRDNYGLGIAEIPLPFLGDVQFSYYYDRDNQDQHNGFLLEKSVLHKIARNIEIGINIAVFRHEVTDNTVHLAVLDSFRPMIQVKLFKF